jgi:hypothetical protein
MHDFAIYAGQCISHLLHRLGIRDHAFDDLRIVGLGTFIIFGLLVIASLKIMQVRAQERKAVDGEAGPLPTTRRSWTVLKALLWYGGLLAVSILIALYLAS